MNNKRIRREDSLQLIRCLTHLGGLAKRIGTGLCSGEAEAGFTGDEEEAAAAASWRCWRIIARRAIHRRPSDHPPLFHALSTLTIALIKFTIEQQVRI